MRSALAKPVQALKTLTDLAKDAAGLAQMLEGAAGGQVTARLQWRPLIKPWGLPGVPNIFKPKDDHALHIDVEVRASASAPPAVDIVAEIVDFDLNLIGDGGGALMRLMFRRDRLPRRIGRQARGRRRVRRHRIPRTAVVRRPACAS